VEEITKVDDFAQTMSMKMFFVVDWLDPRLQINDNASEWYDTRTGEDSVVTAVPEMKNDLWSPDIQIHKLEKFEMLRVYKNIDALYIYKAKTISYWAYANVVVSCPFKFDDYPFDRQICQFRVGDSTLTNDTVQCTDYFNYTNYFIFDLNKQRTLQYYLKIENLPQTDKVKTIDDAHFAACGFQVRLSRMSMQIGLQVYLPTAMFVIVSWTSFLVPVDVIPGRMGVLVTVILVLSNMFNSVKSSSPITASLNAMDLYMIVCVFLVFQPWWNMPCY
jgi:hypothetical protein